MAGDLDRNFTPANGIFYDADTFMAWMDAMTLKVSAVTKLKAKLISCARSGSHVINVPAYGLSYDYYVPSETLSSTFIPAFVCENIDHGNLIFQPIVSTKNLVSVKIHNPTGSSVNVTPNLTVYAWS